MLPKDSSVALAGKMEVGIHTTNPCILRMFSILRRYLNQEFKEIFFYIFWLFVKVLITLFFFFFFSAWQPDLINFTEVVISGLR